MRISLIFAFILAVCLLAPFRAAQATILFVGGEDSDFTAYGSYTAVSTTAGYFSSGYAREALQTAAAAATLSSDSYWLTPTFTSNSTIWIHGRRYVALVAPVGNTIVLAVNSPDGVTRILIRSTTTIGQYKISTRNAAGTMTDLVTAANACPYTSLYSFDLFINYGTSGEVTLYCNGVSYADYVGNVATDSATQLNQVAFSGEGIGSNNYAYWSEIIVATTDTRAMRLVTMAPVANGNADTFDTGGVANVNDTTNNQGTLNASGTAGQIQEYTVSPTFPTGSWNVIDVWVNAQSQVDTTGPQHLQAMVRTGSTDYTSSNLSPLQSVWGTVGIDWTTNPNTSAAWTTTDLSAAGFNIGFKSAN